MLIQKEQHKNKHFVAHEPMVSTENKIKRLKTNGLCGFCNQGGQNVKHAFK